MKAAGKTKAALTNEAEELRKRLKEAEEKLIAYQKNETRPLPSQRLARSIVDESPITVLHAGQDRPLTSSRRWELLRKKPTIQYIELSFLFFQD